MKRAAGTIVLQLLALLGCACAQNAYDPENSNSAPEQHLLRRLNQERELAGLSSLQWDGKLAQAALEHAEALAEHGDLSHQFAGEPPLLRRVGMTGARFTATAENIARVEVADDAHISWMLSPGHRANMLSPEYNRVGIGVVRRKGLLFVTQDFARVLPAYSEDQFRDALISALNRDRASRGLRGIAFVPDPQLHAATCASEGDVHKLAGNFSGRSVRIFSFTLSDPETLPEQASQEIFEAGPRGVRVEVCFRPDDKYGYANFWVALVRPD